MIWIQKRLFQWLAPFLRPKKSRAPQKVSILCRDHLESLNWPHLVIWQGRIHNTTPHLKHRCINSLKKVWVFYLTMTHLSSPEISLLRDLKPGMKTCQTGTYRVSWPVGWQWHRGMKGFVSHVLLYHFLNIRARLNYCLRQPRTSLSLPKHKSETQLLPSSATYFFITS